MPPCRPSPLSHWRVWASPRPPSAPALRPQARRRRKATATRRQRDGRTCSCRQLCRDGVRICFTVMVNGAFSMERDLIKKMTVFLFCRDDVSIQNDHIRDVDWSSHPDFSVNGSPAVNSPTSSTAAAFAWLDRKSVAQGKSGSVLVD